MIDPSKIRWIGFSHFESDECGAMNQWLEAAPHASPVCSMVSAMVNLSDFANRPPRGMADGEVLETGNYRFRFCSTAQLPHGWDAGLLFEESQRTLFCSDLFHHDGDVEPLTEDDLPDRVRTTRAASCRPGRWLITFPTPRRPTAFSRSGRSRAADAGRHARLQLFRRRRRRLRSLAGVMREVLG